jgi:adenylate kinase family enzyme
VQRVVVGGISGCGKSTLARSLSRRLDLPYVDFDALFHGPGWSVRPTFLDDVDAFIGTDRWVTDSDGYEQHVGTRVLDRADTYVWLDYDRPVVMRRVLRRTVRRIVTRERLFNGNRERLLAFADRDHPVRWAWEQHGPRRLRNGTRLTDPHFAHLTAVRLATPAAADAWLAALG